MALGFAGERPGLMPDEPCIFDPPAPFINFSVVTVDPANPDSAPGAPVQYGERDIAPVDAFEGETVVEGVY